MKWNRSLLIGAGAVAVAIVVSAGCSSGDDQAGQASSPTTAASATAAPSSKDHNQADVAFVQQMIPHHQQAIEMSDVVLAKQSIDPRVTDLATRIKAAQGPEITQMQDWLSRWGPPMPPMAPSEGHAGHDMEGVSGDGMGMMSDDDMMTLNNANGVEASRLFLIGMIAHHEGAIAMAQNEIEEGQFTPAVELAQSVVTAQQQEIDTMKGILETL